MRRCCAWSSAPTFCAAWCIRWHDAVRQKQGCEANQRRRLQQERTALQASLERLRADVAREDERMRGFKALMAEHLGITDLDVPDQSQEGIKVI